MPNGSTLRIPEKLLAAKAEAKRQLFSAPPRRHVVAFAAATRPEENVVGVGIGLKVTAGKATATRCIRIYVERKLAKEAIRASDLLPAVIGGVKTDVVETGRLRILPARVSITRTRLRPIQPGSSVGFQFTGAMSQFVMAGTFGAVIQVGGARHILSNNHVLAHENELPLGAPIFQPGLLDGGNPATDRVATLARFIPIQTGAGSANRVDAAIARILGEIASNPTLLPKVGRLASPQPIAARIGLKVEKVGRTTGYTIGEVNDISADVNVDYDAGNAVFLDQVLVRGERGSFSDSGDSGSLIVDRASKRATALLFAGSKTVTIGNPIDVVLQQLEASLVI